MASKNKVVNPKISARKGLVAALVVGAVDAVINVVSTAHIDVLDVTVRAAVIGGLAGLANYLKHRYK